MLFDDEYKTISSVSEGTFRDRGSKFIGYAFPVRSDAEVKDIVASLRNDHSKARHFCWALRIGPDRSVFRINDDGEPAGTAGRPILNSLLSRDLTNILLVVVRYFGGTLLGVPGLINAYKTAAAEALAGAHIVKKTICDRYLITFGYIQMNEVMKLIKAVGIEILSQQFDTDCVMEIDVPLKEVNMLIPKLEKIDGVKASFAYRQ